MTNKKYKTVLTIAGSDSCGGAGIQADLKTFSALGCYGMSVITALTAQNTVSVNSIHPLPVSFVEEQIEAVFSDIYPDAIKIGMLFSADVVEIVAKQLQNNGAKNIVLDPVMISQSNCKLLQDDAIEAITSLLMPLSNVVTPNLYEASYLVGKEIGSIESMESAAVDIGKYGCKSVVIKGGHLEADDNCTDLLHLTDDSITISFQNSRISTKNNHGTGCTFSSAIAAFLAQGLPLIKAVEEAKCYIHNAISHGSPYLIGKGNGPVHHFYNQW